MVFFNNLVEIKRPRKGDENGRTIISTVLPTGRNKETPERGREPYEAVALTIELYGRNKETPERGR